MQLSESQSKLAAALAKAQSEFKGVQKGGENTYDKYSYAKLEDYVAAAAPVLSRHGLSILSSVEEIVPMEDRKTAKGGIEHAVRVRVAVRILHESGEWAEASAWGEGQDRADKAVYKAITGARKYGLAAALNLATTDDPEQDDAGNAPTPQQRPAANGNGKPAATNQAPAMSPLMEILADDSAFRKAMMKSFTARQFTPDQMKAAVAAIAKNFRVEDYDGVPDDKRPGVIAGIDKGLLDKFKRPPELQGPATPEQVTEFHELAGIAVLADGELQRWFGEAGVSEPEEMPAATLAKLIAVLKTKLPGHVAAL